MDAPWSVTIPQQSKLPIDISLPKIYVFADTPFNTPSWTRSFRTNEGPVVTRLTQESPLTKDLKLTLEAKQELSAATIETITSWIRYECGLDDDLQIIRQQRARELKMELITKKNPGFRLYASKNPVEVGILAFLSRKVPFHEFLEVKERFLQLHGTPIEWDPDLRLFPTNHELLELTEEDWEYIGAGQKSIHLGNLLIGDLEAFDIYAYYPVYERGLEGIKQIPGISDYVARIVMIYASRRYQKAFLDDGISDMLAHHFEIYLSGTLTNFDKWVRSRWPDEPAKIIHAYMQDFMPKAMRDIDYISIREKVSQEIATIDH